MIFHLRPSADRRRCLGSSSRSDDALTHQA
jgi:hypothetical protein